MFCESFVAILVVYLVYQLMKARSIRKQWRSITDKITPIVEHHPFWGQLHLISSAEDYFRLTLGLVQKTKTKIYTGWMMFFYPVFAVCHPDTARVLLKSSEPKPVQPVGGSYRMLIRWIGDGLLLSSGRKWERNRRLLTPAFHFDILKPYILEYNQTADLLLKNMENSMEANNCVEVYNLVSLATLDTMLRCALSYDGQVQQIGESHPYVVAVKRLATLVFHRTLSPWYFFDFIYFNSLVGREFTKLSNYVHDFANDVITSRRQALHEDTDLLAKRRLDFLDILLTAKDEGGEGLSHEDIQAEVDTFLFEGHDTTASAISWAIFALGEYPEEQEKVHVEINEILKNKDVFEWGDLQIAKKLTAFLKEVMRMYTTVPLVSRWLTKPLVFDGVEIPANFVVDINIYAIHHHPDVWPDHEEFRPSRFEDESYHDRDPFSYIPFSAGPRNCIGQQFALNEQKVMIARLLKRYKIHLVPGHNYSILPELVMRAKHGIKVRLEKRV